MEEGASVEVHRDNGGAIRDQKRTVEGAIVEMLDVIFGGAKRRRTLTKKIKSARCEVTLYRARVRA